MADNNTRSLLQLVDTIKSHGSFLSKLYDEAQLPQPSLRVEDLPQPGQVPKAMAETRAELLDALDELRALVLGPKSYLLFTAVFQPSVVAIFRALYTYKIASYVPTGGSISFAELAGRCGLAGSDVQHVVKLALSLRIFEEGPPGYVKHNAVSAVLNTTLGHDAMGFAMYESLPGAMNFAQCISKYPGSEKDNESPVAMANGWDGTADLFTGIANDPERVQRVANCMAYMISVPETSIESFLNDVPWSPERGAGHAQCPKVIVDIGGSNGHLCNAFLRKYPGIEKAIVEDLPSVTKVNLENGAPEDLAGRIEYRVYDAFTEQTVKDADVYMFRTVMHDWTDSYAVDILRNQIPALKPGAKLLINDACIDASRSATSMISQAQYSMDMLVKLGLNAKERTLEEWTAIVAKADARFEVTSVVSPSHSMYSTIEITWGGGN
ncbi:S-adenosyl-L-methionine-dependent methyltransferase [Hypoxylon sp. FL1284]|nr:S-adenosyl-L-methionine-dependent methyltransferase [Hypoxylon sp. FL1284]